VPKLRPWKHEPRIVGFPPRVHRIGRCQISDRADGDDIEGSANDDETQILSVPIRLRRTGREITMRIDGTDPFTTAKPDARLIKLLIRARRFNAALVGSDGVPFAALAKRQGVSPSYFTRLVRLSYLAPDITQAILDGRQPPDLTADKLLADSRLPLAWHEQRGVLGFA
jgi:hypothetical protein